MSRLKGFFVAALWMAMPVAAGGALLHLERQGSGPVVIETALERARGVVAALTSDPATPASAAEAIPETPSEPAPPGAISEPIPVLRRIAVRDAPATDCKADTENGIAVGDTVSVRFFEDVATTAQDAPVTFERRDLAASVQVGRDGTVALPALGRVAVYAKRPACLERELAQRAAERVGFRGRTGITFAARPAALVRGAVLRPGSYAYDPAMTPARLVTLAGHVDGGGRIGTAERDARAAQAAELRAARLGLVLHAARLRAALDGSETLDLPAGTRAEIAASLGPAAVETETGLLRSDLRSLQDRRDIAADRARQASERVDRLQATLDATEAELAHVRDRRDRLSSLLDTGAITSNRLDDAERSLLSLERERLERASALEDARTAADVARQDARLAETAWRDERLETLRNTDLDLRGLEARMAGLKTRTGTENDGTERAPRFTLERMTPDGPVRRRIGADAILMPGDLVTVSLPAPDLAENTQ